MTPDEYRLLGKHIAGGSVYISNFILWFEAGYFDVSSDTKPLLHLWSLGIEEQFYIVWPFVILILLKLKLRLETFLFLFFLSSFGLNAYRAFIATGPLNGTFYAPPTRFWELAVGGVLAAAFYRADPIWNKLSFFLGKRLNSLIYSENQVGNEVQTCKDVLSCLGLALIAFSIVFFNSGMIFPGSKALLPTLGTALVIAAGPEAFVNRKLLSLKLMVFIGLISYPLYLWHWPLLSFARIFYGEVPPKLIRIALVVAAMLLAWITYRFIEPPLRWGKHSRIKAVCLFVTLLLVGFGGIKIYKNYGYPERVGFTVEEIQKYINLEKYTKESTERCLKIFPDWKGENIGQWGCKLQKEDKLNTVALVGDSHAERLFYGLSEYYSNDNQNGVAVFSAPSQSPFINLRTSINNIKNDRRYLLINKGYKYIFEDPKIKTVILAHFPWAGFEGGVDYLDDPNNKDVIDVYSKAIRKTFDELKNHHKNVIYVLDNPYPKFDPHLCASRPISMDNDKKNKCYLDREEYQNKDYLKSFNNIIADVIRDYNIKVINSFDLLCDSSSCPISRNGRLLYMDEHHLSYEGSRIITQKLIEVINQIHSEDKK